MPDTKMVKVADYCSVVKGKIGIKKAIKGEYPLVTTAEERLSHNEYHFDRPSVIIPLVSSTGHGHASLKRIHYQEGKFAVGSILCAVTPKDESVLNAQFLYHYLDVYKEKLLVPRMRGMANVTLPVTEIEDVEFPLLSADKQKEWVSLFENTSSYTDSLTSEIDYQQTFLRKLRQSILQDAISGKLSEKWRRDNPDVEPASELLAHIKAEKERLIKEKKIKKQKPLLPITENEIPFDLPEGWAWCRLGEIGNASNYPFVDGPFGSSIDTKKDYVSEGIPVLRMMNIKPFRFIDSPLKYVREEKYQKFTRHNVFPGDILFAKVGAGIGEACVVPDGFLYGMLSTTGITRMRVGQIVVKEYLCNFLNANIDNFMKIARQSLQPFLNMTQIKTFPFPLPPLAEQKVIVSKVEKLFTYCGELEQQISKSQQETELLMQTVLKEAFETK